jgi:lysophospholipase L1-like esterase
MSRSARRVSTALVLGCALAVSLPVYVLTNPSFHPFAARFHLEGRSGAGAFELPTAEPLVLEYEIAVRAPDGDRPTVHIGLNGVPVVSVGGEALYRTAFDRRPLPLEAIRGGRSELTVEIEGLPGASFDINARVHNYTGIAPDFPRAAVVPDEALEWFLASQSTTRRVVRFAAIYLGALLLYAGLAWLGGPRATAVRHALVWSPAAMLTLPLAYSLATPVHLWLSAGALAVLVIGSWLFAAGGYWVAAHRQLALRLAVSTALTLGLLEAALRVVNAVSPMFIFYSDSFGRYRGQPGAPHYDTRLNSRGFNDRERSVTRPPGVERRVVAIGDSFAFGTVPYSDNYLTLAERALERDARVEVVNMGVAGTEPRDYLAILVEEALAYRPDLVMVGFYTGNDFEARERKTYEHSYVATLGNFLWHLGRAGRTVVVTDGGDGNSTYDDEAPSLSLDRFLQIQVERSQIYTGSDAWLNEAAARAVSYLTEIRDVAGRSGAGFLVVLIPDEVQVDAELQDQLAVLLDRTRGSIDFARPTTTIVRALAQRDIKVLDLLPLFVEQGRHTRLYKPLDTHWNRAGNRLAADAVARELREALGARPSSGEARPSP